MCTCVFSFLLFILLSSLYLHSPCFLLSNLHALSNISKHREEDKILTKLETVKRPRVNEGEMTWIFCAALILYQSPSQSMNEGAEGEKKNTNKRKIGCAPPSFLQPPDNSTAIDNQSLISLISPTVSVSLFLFCFILSFLSSPCMSPAKILNLLRGHARGPADPHKRCFYAQSNSLRSVFLGWVRLSVAENSQSHWCWGFHNARC